jgi:integrase
MKRQFRVKKYKWAHGKYVVEGRENGKRARKFYETKDQAEAFARLKNIELENFGREHAEFPESLRIMAQECAPPLKAFGKTIADATKFYLRYLEASERSCTVAELVDEILKAKKADGASARYVADLDYRLNHFASTFGEQKVSTITSAKIDDWLRALNLSPISRNNYRRVVLTMFSFAVQRGYAIDNPAERTAKAKVVGEAPGILTVQETVHLLEAASPELLPYVAIGAFAGLRRAELERLDWSEIDFDSGLIEVTAAKAKAARRRFVTMQPNLREWLLPLRKHRGSVVPADNFRQAFDAARMAAGIVEWPDNALRHSFASYHMAHFKNAAETALQLGHHDSRITFAHYRELVKPKEAERYWNIRPAAKGKKVVEFAARA